MATVLTAMVALSHMVPSGGSASASAQAPATPPAIGVDPASRPWDAIELGTLPGLDDWDHFATALNAYGVVVGYAESASTLGQRPWVWFPCESVSFGLPARQMIDLSDLCGIGTDGRALGVNSAGIVVGTMLDPTFGGGGFRPVYWDVASFDPLTGQVDHVFLGQLTGEARAVSDASGSAPWRIVVEKQSGLCANGSVYEEGDPPTTLTALDGVLSAGQSQPYAIATSDDPSGSAIVAGHVEACVFITCPVSDDATRWEVPDAAPVQPVQLREDFSSNPGDPQDFTLWLAQARAVNPQGMAAGHRRVPSLCVPLATLWPANGTALDLSAAQPGLVAGSRTLAQGISPELQGGALTIVGRDDLQVVGVSWWRSTATSTIAATNAAQFCFRSPSSSTLTEFVAINASGWIAANSLSPSSAARRAFLLAPSVCFDLDGDGEVGPEDLAVLLGAWTTLTDPCPTCCIADLDGDGTVGPVDLALLLGAWGTACDPCDLLTGGSSESQSNASAESLAEAGSVGLLLSYFGVQSTLELGALLDAMSPEGRMQALPVIEALLSEGGVQ